MVSLALWLVPLFRPILTPLIYFNTHIHELCHALMGMATGGSVLRVVVESNGNGHALIGGGNLILTASAGYVG
ncbi:MAG: M50 family metallopeptidase, partial [Fimbriimonadales bacterium]